jgi:UDP-N-acetylmuramoyl-L-alanyl-D-glutamate--2,6-diaminopimelate ligase
MKLGELVSALMVNGPAPGPWSRREVTAVVQDSRRVAPGSLFVAVRGFHSDGHQFISQAVRQGAVAVVAEESAVVEAFPDTPVIRVPDSRKALARLAATFYDYPSRRIKLVGITGTKGKTTTSYLTRSIIEAAGQRTGLIGTIDYRIGDRVYPAPNTTPESLDLQALFAEMAERGTKYCVLEVSSHALALGRTDECVFEAAAFTNLAHEHLDFHKTMDEYGAAKALLFRSLSSDKTAVINLDDASAGGIIRKTAARIITYGMTGHTDVRPAGTIGHSISGLSFAVSTPAGGIGIESSLVGRHNIYNILAAVGLGIALGFSGEAIAAGIKQMKAVPGRMEKVDAGQPFGVLVDYAHTEGSLFSLLETVREMTVGRVITVFGCGGDRDRAKRPKMGAAAISRSDLVIVTSDNPRTEDPLAIIGEIESGMTAGIRMDDREPLSSGPGAPSVSKKTPYAVIPDRAEAIETAVRLAGPGDVVVLAGKGHEDYQIIGEHKFPFDDREEARKAIVKCSAECGVRNAN